MQTYTTQMDAARKGIVTEQMKRVAEKEHLPVEQLRELVAEGKVAICANKRHTCLDPEGRGQYAAHQGERKPGGLSETARIMMWKCRRL